MKKVAVLMAVLLLFGAVGVQAAGDGEAMAAAITLVKERVEIPEGCTEFTGTESLSGGVRSWNLMWDTPADALQSASVSVQVCEGGIIENVYTYVYNEEAYRSGKILPKITEEEAAAAAYAYAARMNPALATEYSANAEINLYGDRYSVYIPRTVGGIPVYNNSAAVQVDSRTGMAENYRVEHTEKAVFAAEIGAIGEAAARAAYMQNGYMRPEYVLFDKEAKLVYTPGKRSGMLDAKTGAVYTPNYDEIYTMRSESTKNLAQDSAVGGALSPQELQAVEEAAGLISYETAAQRIMSTESFYIPEGMALESGNTYKTEAGRYILHVSLKSTKEDSYARVYGELDGISGEILYFYVSDKDENKGAADEGAARQIYDSFSASHLKPYAAFLAEAEVKAEENAVYITAERQENGIPVSGDGVSMTIGGNTGKITHYRLTWNREAVFPAPDGMLSEEAAYNILFEKAVPKLYYFAKADAADPIYVTEGTGFAYIDAKNGGLLTYSGEAYVEVSRAAYTDIAGHFAEEAILALASIDARLGDAEFKPDAVITQAEFVGLVTSCVMDYYPISGGRVDAEKLYSYAVRRGILPKDEEAPDAPLTRELAVAYLLRAMEYGSFAEIEGIFRCDFADADAITPALYGYVAIAKGLGIVSGDPDGNFAPAREITRGEAAVIIYNYLK